MKAARLNRTRVRKVIHTTTENEIRAAVLEATANGMKVTIAANGTVWAAKRFSGTQLFSTC